MIGIGLISFSSVVGDGLVDNANWDFLKVILFTIGLLGFSFLITDDDGGGGGCCFFFGLINACSTLIFLGLVGIGENDRFCTGERRATVSGGGGLASSSPVLSSLSSLFPDIEWLSLIF